jgi:hypothetical protein
MASKLIKLVTNGSANRKCQSWIDRFVEYTDNLESPLLFRKWTAISVLASALEQRVWLTTSDKLFPNLYTVLVGYPGVGKTRTIMKGRAFLAELDGFCIAPTDMTKSSLVDALLAARRIIVKHPPPADEFHSMTLMFDEWGVLLSSFEGDVIPTLTTFYDVTVPYEQHRRGKEIRIKIPRPQLSVLAGSTPSNLIKFIPDFAWDQGFTSRLILVYSAERGRGDDFASQTRELPPEMMHDLKAIFALWGECKIDPSFRQVVNEWRAQDENPRPTHPKLLHYNARRRAHLYKLSIVAAVDRGDLLMLNSDHFYTALDWLTEIEKAMPEIFVAGQISVDSRAMDEIEEFILRQGKPVTEHRILRFASNLLPVHSIVKVLYIMQASKRLKRVGDDPITYITNSDDPI